MEPEQGPPIVALVCSAGGLQALQHVLAPLPADFPAAVLLLQHQSPRHHSLLAPILARTCPLPVRAARSGDALIAGTVLVVPPGTHALATVQNALALIASDGPASYRPSADLLLTSLAVTAGPRVIAVVLSGGGTDGATGAVAVHALGGTVIAADRFLLGSVRHALGGDRQGRRREPHVLPVEELPRLLAELVPAVGAETRQVASSARPQDERG